MKKNLFSFLSVVLMAIVSVGFVSCGDDDDENGSASDKTGVIKTGEGNVRLYRVGDFRFYYNEDGTLDYYDYYGGYEKHQFSYHPNKLTIDDDLVYDIDYTSEGNIAKASFSEKGEDLPADVDHDVSESGTATFSYDSNGHLKSISFKGQEVYYEDGTRYTDKGTGSIKFTWSNNLLRKIVFEEQWTENGKIVEDDKEIYEFFYDDDNPNPFCQYAPDILDYMDSDFEVLGLVGLFGKGPVKLPSSVIETEDDGDTHTRSFYYSFNEDGTLRSANGVYYYYNEISADDNTSIFKSPRKPVEKKGFFSRMANRHNR